MDSNPEIQAISYNYIFSIGKLWEVSGNVCSVFGNYGQYMASILSIKLMSLILSQSYRPTMSHDCHPCFGQSKHWKQENRKMKIEKNKIISNPSCCNFTQYKYMEISGGHSIYWSRVTSYYHMVLQYWYSQDLKKKYSWIVLKLWCVCLFSDLTRADNGNYTCEVRGASSRVLTNVTHEVIIQGEINNAAS